MDILDLIEARPSLKEIDGSLSKINFYFYGGWYGGINSPFFKVLLLS
jgi:hypothetical protein